MKKLNLYYIFAIVAYVLMIPAFIMVLYTPSFFTTNGQGYIWDVISMCFKNIDFTSEGAVNYLYLSIYNLLFGIIFLVYFVVLLLVPVLLIYYIVVSIIGIVKQKPITVITRLVKRREKQYFREGNFRFSLGPIASILVFMFVGTYISLMNLGIAGENVYMDFLKEIYFGVSSNPVTFIYVPAVLSVIAFGFLIWNYIQIKHEIKIGSDVVLIKEKKSKKQKAKEETEENKNNDTK